MKKGITSTLNRYRLLRFDIKLMTFGNSRRFTLERQWTQTHPFFGGIDGKVVRTWCFLVCTCAVANERISELPLSDIFDVCFAFSLFSGYFFSLAKNLFSVNFITGFVCLFRLSVSVNKFFRKFFSFFQLNFEHFSDSWLFPRFLYFFYFFFPRFPPSCAGLVNEWSNERKLPVW